MKTYEIQVSLPERDFSVPLHDRSYTRLSDAAADLKSVLHTLQEDQDLISDDLSMTLVRNVKKKGTAGQQTPVVQLVAGLDEDSSEFCYEGIYFLSRCSDFERMILMGEKKSSWIGDYAVRIEGGDQSELCFFSDLEMILESIKDLRQDREQIRNRLMTLSRRKKDNDRETEVIAQLLYTVNPDGSLRLQSRIDIDAGEPDGRMLREFVRQEQDQERAEDTPDSQPTAQDGIETVEEVATSA